MEFHYSGLGRPLRYVVRRPADQEKCYYEYPLTPEMEQLIAGYPDHSFASMPQEELHLRVDRERARFSSWYELFPRSASPDPKRHGTLRDVEILLPDIAAM